MFDRDESRTETPPVTQQTPESRSFLENKNEPIETDSDNDIAASNPLYLSIEQRSSFRHPWTPNETKSDGSKSTKAHDLVSLHLRPFSFSRNGVSEDTGAGQVPMQHPPNPHYLPVTDGQRLRKCRDILLRAFTTCLEEDSADLCCVISCTINASRRLRSAELQAAVAMHAYAQHSQRRWMHCATSDFQAWLAGFGVLFTIDDTLYVSFTLPETTYFLRNFRVRGIDSSHRTIARICIAFMELTGQHQEPSMLAAFCEYATQNWQYHREIAARTSISLRYDKTVRRRIRSLERRLKSVPYLRRNISPVSAVEYNFQELDIKDERDDWVFIENP